MPWFKVDEDHYSVNRKTRDRKGGHSPSMLFDAGGVCFTSQEQKRTQKRIKTRVSRYSSKHEIRTLVQEMIEDIELEAEELRAFEESECWDDIPDGWDLADDPEDDPCDEEPLDDFPENNSLYWEDYFDYGEPW